MRFHSSKTSRFLAALLIGSLLSGALALPDARANEIRYTSMRALTPADLEKQRAELERFRRLTFRPLPEKNVPADPTYTITTDDGETHQFRLLHGTNEHGVRELEVQHLEIRRALPDGHHPVLWGRDLDSDGLLDAWFFHGDSGVIEAVEGYARREDGWDAASYVLKKHVDFSNRWYLAVAFDAVTTFATLTRSRQVEFDLNLMRRQMDLRELEIRTGRLSQSAPALAPTLARNWGVIADGWEDLSQRVISRQLRSVWVNAGSDIAMDLAGIAAIRSLGRGVSWLSTRVRGTELGGRIYDRFAAGILGESRAVARRVTHVARAGGRVASASVQFARLPAREQAVVTLRALEVGSRAARQVAKSGYSGAKVLGRSGLDKKGYIARSQMIQIAAEIYGRRDVILDPDPVMVAKNIASNEEMLQNVAYMTAETFLLTSISNMMTNIPKRIVIGGMVAVTNSLFMNFVIKGEGDPGRITLDTGWEVVVGNLQIQADLEAENYFKRLAESSSNPRLKTVGVAFGIVDQAAGYLAYNCMTEAYNRRKDGIEQAPNAAFSEKACDKVIDTVAGAVETGGRWFHFVAPRD